MSEPYLYAGLSGTTLGVESFDLGSGIQLSSTFAHLFSPYMVAFAPPMEGVGYHPGPWRPASGGTSFDIEIELRVPNQPLIGDLEAKETIWWIAALLRIARTPYLSVPVTSNHPFATAREGPSELQLRPFEVTRRIFQAKPEPQSIDAKTLAWVKEKWQPAGQLLVNNSKFYTAVKAFDGATVAGKTSSAMLALWGGLEQLFAPSAGELRFRVSALIAAYSEPPGAKRLECYKRVLKLYNERSQAAHTASEVTKGPLLESYVLMRNVLVRMIDECEVPTQSTLEDRLFGVDATPATDE